jgi:hypothetical protein
VTGFFIWHKAAYRKQETRLIHLTVVVLDAPKPFYQRELNGPFTQYERGTPP